MSLSRRWTSIGRNVDGVDEKHYTTYTNYTRIVFAYPGLSLRLPELPRTSLPRASRSLLRYLSDLPRADLALALDTSRPRLVFFFMEKPYAKLSCSFSLENHVFYFSITCFIDSMLGNFFQSWFWYEIKSWEACRMKQNARDFFSWLFFI